MLIDARMPVGDITGAISEKSPAGNSNTCVSSLRYGAILSILLP
jgi:hypothetical protein